MSMRCNGIKNYQAFMQHDNVNCIYYISTHIVSFYNSFRMTVTSK